MSAFSLYFSAFYLSCQEKKTKFFIWGNLLDQSAFYYVKKQKFGEKKMKKTAIAAVILLALAGAAFCEKQEIPVDVYDDGT